MQKTTDKKSGKRPEAEKTSGPDLLRFIDRFKGKKICVVGDIIADVFILGKPYRLSREAPVVVVKYEGSKIYPGSAGNTINNLSALGANVYPIGFVGNDSTGNKLMDFFAAAKNIDTRGIIRHNGATITKTRILAGDTHTSKQQVIRIDRDEGGMPSKQEKILLMEKLTDICHNMDETQKYAK